jgi:hypothetical protein
VALERLVTAELLDDLAPEDPRAQRARRDLRRIHRAMGTLSWLQRSTARLRLSRPPRSLIELGAGDGTLLLRFARALEPRWPGVALTLLDRQRVLETRTLRGFDALGWQTTVECRDALEWAESPESGSHYDLCVTTLFLHHFPDGPLQRLLRGIAGRSEAFLAIEPRRSTVASTGSHLVGLLGANAVTREDAVKSVVAGFSGREISASWPVTAQWWTEEFPAWPFSHVFLAAHRSARAAVAT